MTAILLKLLPILPGPALDLVSKLGLWWLKYTGAKEEELKVFEEAIRSMQSRPKDATQPADDEEASRKRLEGIEP
jgi:hypothetical protein